MENVEEQEAKGEEGGSEGSSSTGRILGRHPIELDESDASDMSDGDSEKETERGKEQPDAAVNASQKQHVTEESVKWAKGLQRLQTQVKAKIVANLFNPESLNRSRDYIMD